MKVQNDKSDWESDIRIGIMNRKSDLEFIIRIQNRN